MAKGNKILIVMAAGSGSRMKTDVKKQYMEIGGKPLIYYSIKAFEESAVDDIVLVVSRGDVDYVKKEIVAKYRFDKKNSCIEVYEIPYTTTLEDVIDGITEIVKEGKIKDENDLITLA